MPELIKSDVLSVLRDQHRAIDALMAHIIAKDSDLLRAGLIKHEDTFKPSQSGWIWLAAVKGNELIGKLEAEIALQKKIATAMEGR